MANLDIMALTEKQKAALHKIHIDDQLEMVDYVFDCIGFVSVKEYAEVRGISTRDVYRLINADKVIWRNYSGMYFVAITPKQC